MILSNGAGLEVFLTLVVMQKVHGDASAKVEVSDEIPTHQLWYPRVPVDREAAESSKKAGVFLIVKTSL